LRRRLEKNSQICLIQQHTRYRGVHGKLPTAGHGVSTLAVPCESCIQNYRNIFKNQTIYDVSVKSVPASWRHAKVGYCCRSIMTRVYSPVLQRSSRDRFGVMISALHMYVNYELDWCAIQKHDIKWCQWGTEAHQAAWRSMDCPLGITVSPTPHRVPAASVTVAMCCYCIVCHAAFRHLQPCQLVTREQCDMHPLPHPHDYTARRGGGC
jgi:hypothetical protein